MRIILLNLLIFSHSMVFSQVDTTIYSFDGKNQFKGQVLNGKQIGTWKELDSIGELLKTIEIIDEKGKCKITPNFKDSNFTGYYHGYFILNKIILNGKSKITNLISGVTTEGYFSYGRKSGQWREYKNDVLIGFEYYEHNKDNYLNIPFKGNGNIMRVSGMSSRGFHSGVFVDFDDSTHVSAVGYFDDGCKIGEWSYFKDGKLYCKGFYYPDYIYLKSINDTMCLVNRNDSLARNIYSEEVIKSFKISEQVLFIKHGKWQYFDKNGQLMRIDRYEKGVFIKSKKVRCR